MASFSDAIPTLVSSAFVLFSVFLIYKLTEKTVFDKRLKIFWKGRKKPEHLVKIGSFNNYSHFSNIQAIQLITELCDGGDDADYYSFELNLVLNNGSRINVVDHGSQEAIREDADHLSVFLNVPIWEFQQERERSFFVRFPRLRL